MKSKAFCQSRSLFPVADAIKYGKYLPQLLTRQYCLVWMNRSKIGKTKIKVFRLGIYCKRYFPAKKLRDGHSQVSSIDC